MVKNRKKIGILFGYSNDWIGGSYYFLNLIKALRTLDDKDKPHLIIISNDSKSIEIVKTTQYPYLSFLSLNIKLNIIKRIINKISRLLLNKNIFKISFDKKTLPVIFGYYEQIDLIKCKRKIYWIPDFQDRYYPEYFTPEIIKQRQTIQNKLAYSKEEIVLSSYDSENDFKKFYPQHNCRVSVLPFAVSNKVLNDNIESVKKKLEIKWEKYFISPNQFWPHKNHITLIKAVEILKNKNIDALVIFTGNENTNGGKYTESLKTYIDNKNLNNNFKFLGFIDRDEQLLLIKNSIAVIQPSLFEGWSTVVEDAKSLNKFVILSDLSIHKEQIKSNGSFFKSNNPNSLSNSVEQFLKENNTLKSKDYSKNIYEFAQRFNKIINN